MTHKKPVVVRLLLLPNTKSGSPVHYWIELTSILKSLGWIMRGDRLTCFAKIELSNIVANADKCVGEIRQFCKLQDDGQSLMRAAMSQLNLSARAYHRILKLARTIADLAGSEEIQSTHLAEALQYRPILLVV
jgi:hypothetical protein